MRRLIRTCGSLMSRVWAGGVHEHKYGQVSTGLVGVTEGRGCASSAGGCGCEAWGWLWHSSLGVGAARRLWEQNGTYELMMRS